MRVTRPDLPVHRHLSTAAQIADLREGRLDIAFVRERVPCPQFDAMLVVTERLGVLLPTELADELTERDAVRLDALTGLRWIRFPREESPARWDLVVAVLHSHGITIDEPSAEESLIAPVKLAAVPGRPDRQLGRNQRKPMCICSGSRAPERLAAWPRIWA